MNSIRTRPSPDAVLRLKVQCGSCYHLMSQLLEDPDGSLWLVSGDRLLDPRTKEYYNDGEIRPARMGDDLYSGCSKAASPDCGRAYSWKLDDHAAELAKARATGKPQKIRL